MPDFPRQEEPNLLKSPTAWFSTHRFTQRSEDAPSGEPPEPGKRWITTTLGGRDRIPHMLYFLAVILIGLPLCVRTMLTNPLPQPATCLLLVVLGIVSYHIPVSLSSNVQSHPGFPLVMGALYTYGISGAILVLVPSTLLFHFTKKHGILNCLFNASQFTICLYATSLVGSYAGWKPGLPSTPVDLLRICLMIFVFDVLNILFISGSRSIETKEPIWSSFSKIGYAERKSVLPQRVFLSIVSMLLSSFMGDVALVIVFIGVLFLGFQDVLHKELVEKIEEADIDPLTGVYNMRYLHRWMTAELSLMPGMGPEFSLIFADIDGLKTVNDTYGHETGNELLIYFSKILKDTVRKQDRVARYGGDEFIVVCPATTLEQAQVAALRILRAMGERPFLVDQAILEFGVSMGVAAWPEHGETVSDLIRVADKAMYLAKKDGGNTVRTALDL